MGEIADDMLANFMESGEWYDNIGSERPILKTCRFCGTKGLHWKLVEAKNTEKWMKSKWRLHYKDGKRHYCMGGVAILPPGVKQ